MLEGNPNSFVHVIRAGVDTPEGGPDDVAASALGEAPARRDDRRRRGERAAGARLLRVPDREPRRERRRRGGRGERGCATVTAGSGATRTPAPPPRTSSPEHLRHGGCPHRPGVAHLPRRSGDRPPARRGAGSRSRCSTSSPATGPGSGCGGSTPARQGALPGPARPGGDPLHHRRPPPARRRRPIRPVAPGQRCRLRARSRLPLRPRRPVRRRRPQRLRVQPLRRRCRRGRRGARGAAAPDPDGATTSTPTPTPDRSGAGRSG